MDVQELLEILRTDRKAAMSRERQCRRNIKACAKNGDAKEELYWEQEYDKAWLEASRLGDTILVIKEKLEATSL